MGEACHGGGVPWGGHGMGGACHGGGMPCIVTRPSNRFRYCPARLLTPAQWSIHHLGRSLPTVPTELRICRRTGSVPSMPS